MVFEQEISTIVRTSQPKNKRICLFKDINLDYSRVEVASDTRHSARCCGRPPLLRCNEVDVVARRETTAAISCNERYNMRSPRFARDDNFFKKKNVVRFARPKGKRCRHRVNILPYSDVVTKVSADFMNNSG